MEFSLLGPLELREDGRVIPLGGVKQRALLAVLLLHANEVVSRDYLIDSLWGEEPPVTAVHTVETYVSRLRRILHDVGSRRTLITRPPGYMVRVEPEALDINRFENLTREGRRTLAEGNPVAAAELFRQALVLFRGAPLDDVAFFPFAQGQVERLGEMRLAALADRIDADLAVGRSAELVGELQELVNVYPLQERLRGQLMLAFYRSGRQADGLEAYRKARQYLAEQVGVEPAGSLRRLEKAILLQDPSLDALPSSEPTGADTPYRGEPASAIVAIPPPVPTAAPICCVAEGAPEGHAELAAPRPQPVRRKGLASVPWRFVILLAALLPLTLLGVGITTALHGAPSLEAIHPDAVGIIDPANGAIVGQVPLEAAPGQIALAAGSVWVTDSADHAVLRIENGQVRQVIRVGAGPSGIAVGSGAVWVANTLGGTVTRIDPGTDQVVQTIPVGNQPTGIAYGEGAVWVANTADHTVVGIDPRTGKVFRSVGLDASPTDLAVGAGAVWVTSQSSGQVFQISPDGRDVATVKVGTGPGAIAASHGAVWVANTLDGTISRIDPSRRRRHCHAGGRGRSLRRRHLARRGVGDKRVRRDDHPDRPTHTGSGKDYPDREPPPRHSGRRGRDLGRGPRLARGP